MIDHSASIAGASMGSQERPDSNAGESAPATGFAKYWAVFNSYFLRAFTNVCLYCMRNICKLLSSRNLTSIPQGLAFGLGYQATKVIYELLWRNYKPLRSILDPLSFPHPQCFFVMLTPVNFYRRRAVGDVSAAKDAVVN